MEAAKVTIGTVRGDFKIIHLEGNNFQVVDLTGKQNFVGFKTLGEVEKIIYPLTW